MRKLLYVSLPFFMMGCGASEDSVRFDSGQDSTVVMMDSSIVIIDSLNTTVPIDSVNRIIHGTPNQEKLDSIKNAKGDKKKRG